MAVTQKFIAQQAGVSQKTVSLFFQDSPLVAERTRKKLRGLTKKYRYFPNQAARSMKSKRFKRIACVVIQYVTEHDRDLQLRHPHLLAYMNGAALELAQYGYSLVLEPVLIDNLTAKFVTDPNLFSSLAVDGIIGLPGSWVPDIIDDTINAMGLPAVWLNRNPPEPGKKPVACLNLDEATGARLLTEYLIGKGYRKIAWFGPKFQEHRYHYSAAERFEAFRNTMAAHGLTIYRQEFPAVGEKLPPAALHLLQGNPPDAVICSHFSYQEAAVYAAMHHGLSVPRDLDIVHFASSWEYNPDIYNFKTFVLLHEMQIGQLGARYIYKQLLGKNDEKLLTPVAGTLHVGKPMAKDK